MKQSVFIFMSGAVFGIIITMLLPSAGLKNENIDEQLDKVGDAVIELNNATENLQNLVQQYTHVLPNVSAAAMPATANASATTSNNMDAAINSNSQTEIYTQAPVAATPSRQSRPATPPTETQVEQYTTIETQLYEAANNPNMTLSSLIQEADKLTPEQRDRLTKKAMEMIKNNELDPNQFAAMPRS